MSQTYKEMERELMINQVFNEDCLLTMKRMEDNSVDLILTDIPYEECDVDNNGIWDKNSNMQDMHKADTKTFDLDKFLLECDRICKGSFYIFCGIEQVSEIRKFLNVKHSTRLIIWEKTNPMPINGQYVFLSGIETCVWAKKSGATFNDSCRNTVFRYPLGIDRTAHPTTKPLKLFEEFIRISTNEGDVVYDPCMGSGTTAICCKALDRKYIGSELDKEYYEIIQKRLSAVQGSLF